jgi:Fe-S-cluster formation regulator IscX/YfhJ
MLNTLENYAKTQAILSNLPSADTQDLQAIFEHISKDTNAGKLTHLDTLKRFTDDIENLITELNTMIKEHNATIERIIDCVYIAWRVQA